MFIGSFVMKKLGVKRKKIPKHDAILVESSKFEISKNNDFEIYSFDGNNQVNFIENYINSNYLVSRKKSEREFFEDFSIHMNIEVKPSNFEHLKVIGKGYFGKVTQVRYNGDGVIYALKSLKKSKLKELKHIEHTNNERKILEIINHPFIVSLKFAFQTEKKLYFVMDCYNGGELFYHLRHKGRFNESQVKFYLSQIILVIEFLHSKKIIYRDLKPENIVLDKKGYIKLTDFGLAKDNIDDDSGCQTFCGTPEYLAPEIIRGDKYGKSVDIWCIGILLYEMLYGYPPFQDKNKKDLYKKIIFNKPNFYKNMPIKLSPEAKDLIENLLVSNPKSRLKIGQIKLHKFFDGIDFDQILKMKVIPPYIPDINGQDDYRFIDPALEKEKAEDSLANNFSLIIGKEFKDFTYVNNSIMNK